MRFGTDRNIMIVCSRFCFRPRLFASAACLETGFERIYPLTELKSIP
ncbi:hypothetical protein LEP1GSC060_2406 [Leptospira weilii serovar Ranarum str. ICFT]|uniref:Uncharacterized protein n=1 Tax=Leptospira weilii serovar Ranarum str. ICFT TaxID=1218598 RepID=N1WGC4_9LEPT|nr:hypothetical protein LEP1GSC060_2406 [Leptospira weilii serovar Ranarum str. ICFT]